MTLPLTGAHDDAVLAARIEAATGISVRFVGAAREGAGAGAAFGTPDALSPSGGIWSGPLDRLLDAWAQAAGHAWRYDADARRIEIVRSLTAVFRVNALAGSERHGASSSTQDRAGEDGTGSLSAQSIETETVYDPWPEIEAQLAALVGEDTTVAVSPAGASVTVSGPPGDVRRVRGYLAWLNREVPAPGDALGAPLCGLERGDAHPRRHPHGRCAPGDHGPHPARRAPGGDVRRAAGRPGENRWAALTSAGR